MSRLIDAEAITDHEIIDYLGIRYASCLDDVRDMLNDQPTIEAAPVVHGEWITNMCGYIICSNCYAMAKKDDVGCVVNKRTEQVKTKFCPNCGADMRKGGAE